MCTYKVNICRLLGLLYEDMKGCYIPTTPMTSAAVLAITTLMNSKTTTFISSKPKIREFP